MTAHSSTGEELSADQHILLRGQGGMSVDLTLSPVVGPGQVHDRTLTIHGHSPDFDATVGPLLVTSADLTDISVFLTHATTADLPHLTLAALTLPRPGLILDIVACDDQEVTLEIRVTNTDEASGSDGFSFDTTRMALRHAVVQFHPDAASTWPTSRLFDTNAATEFQSLIWQRVSLPDGARLNGVSLSDRQAPPPGGQMAALWGVGFNADCDAELELDLLRRTAPGAIAAVLGTFADGDRFGVVILQSDPLMDQEWLDREEDGAGHNTLEGHSVPAVAATTTATRAAFYADAFTRSVACAERAAAFATTTGWSVLSLADITDHLESTYNEATASDRLPTLHPMLLALLGEAVGVPLPTVLAARGCLLPEWEHDCQHDPVADALAAWRDGLVHPEQFLGFHLDDAFSHPASHPRRDPGLADQTKPAFSAAKPTRANSIIEGFPESDDEDFDDWDADSEPTEGDFVARFASFLGPRADAPPQIEAIFARAQAADEAPTDAEEAQELEAGLHQGLSLLAVGAPAGYQQGLRDLTDELALIFSSSDD